MIKAIEPGMKEYQAQAILEFEARMGGSEYQGYPSISGAGKNACVLHYSFNRSKLESGELLLADMGAEYHGYTADITRTLPVNGKFTAPQLILYELVLKAQNAGIAQCFPGKPFLAAHFAARKVIAEGLLDLGIIGSEADVMNYFMHGTSHYLGLDVHDPGTQGELKSGTVMTVEPGIYIRKGAPCDPKWWNTGIRIEDDILVTEEGPVNLSGSLVRDPAAIEKMMVKGIQKK
jgi:Xaa-Pro aminopeptidase